MVAITNVTKFTAISRWKPDTHFNLKRLVRKAVTGQLTFGNWWNVASAFRNVMNKDPSGRFSSLWGARKKNKCLNLAIRTMPVDGKHFSFYCNCLPNKQFNPTWNLASDEWIRSMRLQIGNCEYRLRIRFPLAWPDYTGRLRDSTFPSHGQYLWFVLMYTNDLVWFTVPFL